MSSLGGAAFAEKVCHWGQVLRIEVLQSLPVHALCFVLMGEDKSSQLPDPPRCLPLSAALLYQDKLFYPWNHKTKSTLPSISCLDHSVLIQEQKSNKYRIQSAYLVTEREIHQKAVPHLAQTGAQAAYCGGSTDQEKGIFFSPSHSANA